MKKLFTICILLMLLTAKSNAQTQFPFYGFELSNYEVGDSLEYSGTYIAQSFYTDYWTTLYTILNKDILSGDSIKYTIRTFTNGTTTNGGSHSYSIIDTISCIVTNNAVYDNNNNIFNYFLDTLLPGVVIQPDSFSHDTSYVQFDTINNRKHLSLIFETDTLTLGYSATQNIGIEFREYETAGYVGLYGTYSYSALEFYHLTHGGIGGQYYKLLDGVQQPTLTSASAFIHYENNGNAYVVISGNGSYTFQVYDLLGRSVLLKTVANGNNFIDMHTLLKGMYLYKVESNGVIIGQGKLMNMTN